MNDNRTSPPTDLPEELEGRLEEVEDEYLEALHAGRQPDPAAIVAAHPDLEPWLRRRLALLEMVRDLEPQLRDARTGPPVRIGRFEILGLLGQGTFGSVYKARDPQLGRVVAVKVPRVDRFASHEEEERFLREARSAANLKHAGIVALYEVGEERGVPFLVNELIEGKTLAEAVADARPEPRWSAETAARVAEALHHAHLQGVVHRDVKPGNVLLDAAGLPHVTDFGLARNEEDDGQSMTIEGQVLGTPAYMSPEQARGDRASVGARSDVYGLGALLYEMLTGEPPFRGSRTMVMHQVIHEDPLPPRRLQSDVPPDLETICLRAMAKEPARRYGSADELAVDLRRFLRGEPIRARRIGGLERAWRWCRRNPMVASLLALVGLLLIGALAGSNIALLRIQQETRATAAALASTQARLAQAAVQAGFTGATVRDPSATLPWFVRAFELSAGDPERERLHRIRIGTTLRVCPPVTQMVFHEGDVVSAEFDRGGERFVTASADGTARVWSSDNGDPLTPPLRHAEGLSGASFSPDGSRVLTWSHDATARLWSSRTGEPLAKPLAHSGAVLGAFFNPDGTRLVTASRDGTAKIWDAASGEPAGPVLEHGESVVSAVFSPDGALVLTAGEGTAARIWDASKGRLLAALEHPERVNSAAFSPDGLRAVTSSQDRIARLWDVATGKLVGPPLDHGGSLVHDVLQAAFSPDGSRVATILSSPYGRSHPKLWDAVTGKKILDSTQYQGPPTFVTFSPDGRLIASAGSDGVVLIWDWQAGDRSCRLLLHAGSVARVAFHPDGRRVLTAAADHAARLWDLATPANDQFVLRNRSALTWADVASDEKRIVTASTDGTARVWDVASGEIVAKPLFQKGRLTTAEFSSDGRLIITGSTDGTARIWEAASGAPLTGPLRHAARVTRACFSPDSALAATASDDGTAGIWDAKSGAPARPALILGGKVMTVAFSPDAERLVAATVGGKTVVLELEPPDAEPRELPHGSSVWHSSFSPDGLRVVTAGDDGAAQVWDAIRGNPLGPRLRHRGTVSHAQFNSAGSHVVTGSFDGTARVWEAATGAPASPWIRHGSVNSVSFSPDGRYLAVTGRGEGVRLWDAQSGERVSLDLGDPGTIVRRFAFFGSGTRLLSAASIGIARTWDLTPDPRPLRELALLSTVLSARFVDVTESVAPAEPDAIRAAWHELRRIYPAGMPVPPARAVAWHLDQARAGELAKDEKASLFHLRAALRLTPNNALLKARIKSLQATLPGLGWFEDKIKRLSKPSGDRTD